MNTATRKPAEIQYDEVRPHTGRMLLLAAKQAGKLIDAVLEGLQNAIDEMANHIAIVINFKNRTIAIRDDGRGATREKFQLALNSVGVTVKATDKMGRYGLGLVSPLGKCERFTFTSTPKANPQEFRQWTFVTSEIAELRDSIAIPMVELRNMIFRRGENPRQKHGAIQVPWRTEVMIHNFTTDAYLGQIDRETLTESILGRFNQALVRRQVAVDATIVNERGELVSWKIRGKQFRGSPLPEEKFGSSRDGEVLFRLFEAKKGKDGRKGMVHVGLPGNDYRVEIPVFFRATPEMYLPPPECREALTSGIFEGEILGAMVSFKENRRTFEEGEPLMNFGVALEEWWRSVGARKTRELREMSREAHFQELGLRSLKVLEKLFGESDYLRKLLQEFRIGSVGVGHAKPDAELIGSQAEPSLATKPTATKPSADTGEKKREEPQTEHKGHHPFTAAGPRGPRRTAVSSNSLGLQFSYEGMEGSREPYELDRAEGVIRFNTRHPHWARCEAAGDGPLMRYQEFVAVAAIVQLGQPDEWAGHSQMFLDDLLTPMAFVIAHGDTLAGRRPGRKPGSGKAATPAASVHKS